MRKWMKPKQKGSALFVAIMFSFIGLLIIAGLVAVWYRLTHVIFPVKTYSSVREAAAGGVKLLASYIDVCTKDLLDYGECQPVFQNENQVPNDGNQSCWGINNLKFKLLGSDREYPNPIVICFLVRERAPGFSGGEQFIFWGMNSTAIGPNNVTAYVEAVYRTLYIPK